METGRPASATFFVTTKPLMWLNHKSYPGCSCGSDLTEHGLLLLDIVDQITSTTIAGMDSDSKPSTSQARIFWQLQWVDFEVAKPNSGPALVSAISTVIRS